MTPQTLAELVPGDSGTIEGISGNQAICRRLMEMGLTTGEPFSVLNMAPLGDPIEIRIRGYQLSLRRSEARFVAVTTERTE